MTAPKGLAAAGKALWGDVSALLELDPMQSAMLEAACRQRDRAQKFSTAAAGGEATAARQERDSQLAMTRLLASMRLPDEAGRRPQARQIRGVQAPSGVSSLDRERADGNSAPC